jgi:hypothetical protein
MVRSIDPGCEQIRGTHWPNTGRVVDWNSCRGNHLGQRPNKLHQKAGHMDASDPIRLQKTLAARGPSTYGSRVARSLSSGARSRDPVACPGRRGRARHDCSFSRHEMSELLEMNRPRNQKEGAGNAGCALHPWPPVQKESTGVSNQGYTATAGIPCAMVLRLIRDLPGDHAWLPPSPTRRVSVFASLAPASERQNHTTSPSAPTPLVALTIAPGDVRPSHPAPNVRDDREPPLFSGARQARASF